MATILVFLPGESHRQKAWQAAVGRVAKSWTQLSELTQYMYVCVCIYTPSGFCLSGEPSLTQTLMTVEHLLCASQEARCSCLQCVPLVLQVLRRY